MSESRIEFTRQNIDTYLLALAREYRKRAGKNVPAELILVGGASVLINYGFRNSTTDVDAWIHAASAMKEAIASTGEKFGLSRKWLNTDFTQSSSYSDKLIEVSEYYKTFAHIVEIRTVSAEYLIAMKLMAGRQYKSDLSDILGILAEHERRSDPISPERIRRAVAYLYGSWDRLPEVSASYIEDLMKQPHLSEMYDRIAAAERETRDLLLRFEEKYPNTANEKNANDIASHLRSYSDRLSILEELRKRTGRQ